MSCSVADCLRSVKARGMCLRHYKQWRRDNPQSVRPYARRIYGRTSDGTCLVEECARTPKGLGYCLMHYKAYRRHGTPTPRYRGMVVDGNRICPRCQRDVPAAGFTNSYCGPCYSELNQHRQHLRRAGGGEDFTRFEVLVRDGFICGICGDSIDTSLVFPDPMSASLDHVVPLSRGGVHTLANSQAAHLVCNQRKWAHPAEKAAC